MLIHEALNLLQSNKISTVPTKQLKVSCHVVRLKVLVHYSSEAMVVNNNRHFK